MSDSLTSRIERLRLAQGDSQAMALIALDFMLEAQPETQRELLRQAIEAAAVPHWFDASILAHMLQKPSNFIEDIFETLCSFPMVEQFQLRDKSVFNIHETTRLGLRKYLKQNASDRLRLMSARVIETMADDQEPQFVVERLFHTFLADPDKAADECEILFRDWADAERPETEQIFKGALEELKQTGMAAGRAQAQLLLVVGWIRLVRGEDSKLEKLCSNALDLARSSGHSTTIAWALCLQGDSYQNKGNVQKALDNYQEALTLFEQSQSRGSSPALLRDIGSTQERLSNALQASGRLGDAISASKINIEIAERLVSLEPDKINWQCRLAMAQGRIGYQYISKGQTNEALVASLKFHNFFEQLTLKNRVNTNWQIRLAQAEMQLGDTRAAKGQFVDALAAFKTGYERVAILAENDPSNLVLQSSISNFQQRLGSVFQAKGRLDEALFYFREKFETCRQLVQKAPQNPAWIHQLATANASIGDALLLKGHVDKAQENFQNALEIFQGLAKSDPANIHWQRDLGPAWSKIGDAFLAKRKLDDAVNAYHEELKICEKIVGIDPINVIWRRELALSLEKLVDAFTQDNQIENALEYYRRALQILEQTLQEDSSSFIWQRELALCFSKVGDALLNISPDKTLIHYQKSLNIYEQLVCEDPENSVWLHDLSIAYGRMGNVRQNTGNLGNAASFYLKQISTNRRLVKFCPSFTGAHHALAVAIGNFVALEVKRGKSNASLAGLKNEAISMLEKLVREHPDHERWRNDLDILRKQTGVFLSPFFRRP